jgi:hypothetical protein
LSPLVAGVTFEHVKRGREHPDAFIERYLIACERNKLRKAHRIYRSLDAAGQRRADQLLVEQNLYHLEEAELAQEAADFLGRMAALVKEHGVETASELPPHILEKLDREAENLAARHEARPPHPAVVRGNKNECA